MSKTHQYRIWIFYKNNIDSFTIHACNEEKALTTAEAKISDRLQGAKIIGFESRKGSYLLRG